MPWTTSGRSDTHLGSGNDWPADTLAAPNNLRLLQTVISLTYWTASTIFPGNQADWEQAGGQVGTMGEPPRAARICTPIPPEEVESIGRERESQGLSPAEAAQFT